VPHDERWQERYDDILRAIRSARRKFGQEEETWEDADQPLPFIDMHKWDEELPPAPTRVTSSQPEPLHRGP